VPAGGAELWWIVSGWDGLLAGIHISPLQAPLYLCMLLTRAADLQLPGAESPTNVLVFPAPLTRGFGESSADIPSTGGVVKGGHGKISGRRDEAGVTGGHSKMRHQQSLNVGPEEGPSPRLFKAAACWE
jgi:hypothetical protein